MKYITLVLLAASLVGCSDPTHVEVAAKAAELEKRQVVTTTVLAKYEDCTVYRTGSTWNGYVTWVRCKKEPKVTETETTEYCGKGCTRKVLTTIVDETVK